MAEYLRSGRDYLAIECVYAFEEFGLDGRTNFFRNALGQEDPERDAGRNSQRNTLLRLILGSLRLGPRNNDEETHGEKLQAHRAFDADDSTGGYTRAGKRKASGISAVVARGAGSKGSLARLV